MKTIIYEAFLHRNFEVNGFKDGEIIDTTGVRTYNKQECIKEAKKEFANIYSNKQEYARMCKDNDAASIDITIESFTIEYDGRKLIPTDDLYYTEYEEEYNDYICSIDESNYK